MKNIQDLNGNFVIEHIKIDHYIYNCNIYLKKKPFNDDHKRLKYFRNIFNKEGNNNKIICNDDDYEKENFNKKSFQRKMEKLKKDIEIFEIKQKEKKRRYEEKIKREIKFKKKIKLMLALREQRRQLEERERKIEENYQRKKSEEYARRQEQKEDEIMERRKQNRYFSIKYPYRYNTYNNEDKKKPYNNIRHNNVCMYNNYISGNNNYNCNNNNKNNLGCIKITNNYNIIINNNYDYYDS